MRIKDGKTTAELIRDVHGGFYELGEMPAKVRGEVKSGVDTLRAAASLAAEKAEKEAAKKKKPKKESKPKTKPKITVDVDGDGKADYELTPIKGEK
jgi:23S rRNA A2030 N6-methylase RlmJ